MEENHSKDSPRHSSFSAVFEPHGIARVRNAVGAFIGHHTFDYAMGLVIMFNMVMIIIETDHAAHNDDSIPWVANTGWIILVIFIVELVLRLFVAGISFFCDGWNLFDFFVVVTDFAFSFVGLFLDGLFPISTLRIFRLCKLARVSKVFRVFPELRIMMAGLIGSFRAIFWGSVLLTFVLMVWSIVAVQFIHPLNRELGDVHAKNDCERCPRAFESVLQCTLTFSQQIVAGDSWGQATIPVIEAYPWTAFYFLSVYLTVAVAVMNLILGVVVNVASSEHERLQGEIAENADIEKMCASKNILKMCEEMDTDGSGELERDELLNLRESEVFIAAIAHMNLTKEDLAMAFDTMDADGSGSVSYTELVDMLYKMQVSSTEFMLEQIKYLILYIKDLILKNQETNQKELLVCEEMEQAALDKLSHQDDPLLQQIASKLDRVSSIQEKETKTQTKEPGHPGSVAPAVQPCSGDVDEAGSGEKGLQSRPLGLEMKYLGRPELQIAPGGPQLPDEVLNALLKVSSHFQVDFRDALKHLESSLEMHATTTSTLISQLVQPPILGDSSSISVNSSDIRVLVPSSSASTPMCYESRIRQIAGI